MSTTTEATLAEAQAALDAERRINAHLRAEIAALEQRLQHLQGTPLPVKQRPRGIPEIGLDSLPMDQTPYLHDYTLDGAHGDALLFATPTALRVLVQTIGVALQEGVATTILFDGDGEGYDMNVVCVENDEAITSLTPPYDNPYVAQAHGGRDNPYARYREAIATHQARQAAADVSNLDTRHAD